MIDWSARIDDLMDALRRQEAIDDRMAVEVLLSAMIDCPRTATTWLVLETNWSSRDCHNAWFSFGHTWTPRSLPRLRVQAPWRVFEAEMREWLDSPHERHLFIEPEFERYPPFGMSQYRFLLMRSPRIRSRVPRAPNALRQLDLRENERQQNELKALAQAVLEDPLHARPANPPKIMGAPDFLYYVELVQKLAPWFPDWKILLLAFGSLAIRYAYLFGRTETGQEECDMLARVLKDSVPSWVRRVLLTLLEEGEAKFRVLEAAMQLVHRHTQSIYSSNYELRRLRRAGVLEIAGRGSQIKWRIADRHLSGVGRLLEGRACVAPALASCA